MSEKSDIPADFPIGRPENSGSKMLSEQKAQNIIRRAIELQHAADLDATSPQEQQNTDHSDSGMDVSIIQAAALEAGVKAAQFKIALAESELLQYSGTVPEHKLRAAEAYLGSRERCIVCKSVINGETELVYSNLVELFRNGIVGLNLSGVSDVSIDSVEKPLLAVSLDSSAVWSFESAKKLEYANGLWYGDVKEFLVIVELFEDNRTAVTFYAPLEHALHINKNIGKSIGAVLSLASAAGALGLFMSLGISVLPAAAIGATAGAAAWILTRQLLRPLYAWGKSKAETALKKLLQQLELNLRIP